MRAMPWRGLALGDASVGAAATAVARLEQRVADDIRTNLQLGSSSHRDLADHVDDAVAERAAIGGERSVVPRRIERAKARRVWERHDGET